VRRKLRELQKSPGYGRSKPLRAVAISVLAPLTDEKEKFRTHEAAVILQANGFGADAMEPFVAKLRP